MLKLSIGVEVTDEQVTDLVGACHALRGTFPVFDKLSAVAALRDFFAAIGHRVVFRASKRHKGEWRYWTGTHWDLYPDFALAGDIALLLGGRIDDRQMTSVINTIADQTSLTYATFDRRQVIAFDNTCLALEGGRVVKCPHREGDYSTFRIPHPLVNAKCPEWLKLVRRTLPDPADQKALQQLFGYCMFPSYQGQVMFILSGPPATGKGTLMEVLSRLIGPDRVTGVRMETLGETHGLAPLKGAYVNFDPETAYIAKEGENILKFITGGGSVTINEKYEKQITTPLTVRMVMSCNTLPKFNDKTDALWQRIVIIPFEVPVPDAERVELSALLGRIEPEMSGVAGWALNGLLSLLADGRTRAAAFSQSERARQILDQHRKASDHFLHWYDTFALTDDAEASVEGTAAYRHFDAWVRRCNYGSCGRSVFDAAMARKGHKLVRGGGRNATRKEVFRGVSLRSIDDE